MKQVFVLRHAPKDKEGNVTDEGKLLIEQVKNHLPDFDIITASDKPRAQETTRLLTGAYPITDARASIPDLTLIQEQELFELGKTHPAGIAGVIFDKPEYLEKVAVKGYQLVELIKETLQELPEGGKALIVTHDGPMVAAEKILQNLPLEKPERNYQPLAGFIVDEELHVNYFSLES